ncbi:DUF6541 family protein [Umezawaea tangerina]|uniref:DUF6541 family protein n=1 Tax=Umezawaea tangerina TaxID=84725 RepID=UPI001FE6F146|nr:DUF6541 family protein [Umezawaea tangerina]
MTTIALAVLVLWVPGGLVALATGLRGWSLASVSPLLTYFVAGVAGPWLWKIGIPFTPVTFCVYTLAVAAVFLWLRRFSRGGEPPSPWTRRADAAVALCLLAAFAVGFVVLFRAMGGDLNAIPQDWDAGYHANGIRYIADTGDGSLYGTSRVNWYELPGGLFYPNAYHLVGSLVYTLGGAPVPAVLNATTVLLPGLLALSLAALVRHFGGRAVTAGATALVAVAATSATYDNLWRGPLLPFTVGLAFTPVLATVLDRYLRRPSPDTGAVLAACAVGLLAVHSSTLFGGILFVLPMLVQRWWGTWSTARRDLVALLPPMAVGGLVAVPHLFGALSVSGNIALVDWPSTFPVSQAVGTLLTFQHVTARPQIWLAVALWIGLFAFRRLAALRWVAGPALLFGAIFVLTASFSQPWVAKATSPWWNDQFRLVALATVPLCVVAGHGVAQVHDLLGRRLRVPLVTSAAALGVLVLLSGGLYVRANEVQAHRAYGYTAREDQSYVVTKNEVLAMQELGGLVKPDERVLNDRNDGSLWMYAIAGVHPVAGHYDGSLESPDVFTLQAHFRDYDTDPKVRAAVQHLNVRYVLIGRGFVREYNRRATGLRDLGGADFLAKVYENEDAVVYRLVGPESAAP